MLKVTVEGVEYEHDNSKLMARDAAEIQRYTGFTVPEWLQGLERADANASIALVWLVWKCAGKTVPFDEIDFDLNSLDVVVVNPEPVEDPTPDPVEGEPPTA